MLDRSYLTGHSKIPCDLYLKSNTRYFKRYKEGDSVTIDEILTELGEDIHLYIRAEDYKEMVSPTLPDFDETMAEEEIHIISDKKFNELMKSLKNSKSEWSQARVEKSVNWLKKVSKSNKDLLQHLKKLSSDDLSFSYKKVQILYFLFMNSITSIQSYASDALKILTYMAFFCDCELEQDKETRILTQHDLQIADLTDEEYKRVIHHPMAAAKTVAGIDGLPHGLPTFIMQHHGSKSGFGFPVDLSYNISPMAQIYLVYERFAWYLIENYGRIDIHFLIRHLKEEFDKGVYAQASRSIEKSFDKVL
ncbi:MAG: hypothetical protein H6621_02445 [Halobacteriovoraceae bacterium]|nr:hypothetical protein [Halobacteriovoraceae bacterium]